LDTVDIYDIRTGQWSTARLSQARSSLAGAALGNMIFFAGGYDDQNAMSPSSRVDIYHVDSDRWTTANLSQARARVAGAAAGNQVLFASGDDIYVGGSTVVDIFDITTNSWNTSQISESRVVMGTTALGDTIFFGGGFHPSQSYPRQTDRVDIYHVFAKEKVMLEESS